MRHGSLFSGIGGFDLAAEWMGWENVFHCEINEFCQKVLKYHFPNSISHEDITQTDFTIYRGRIDIITGGFPCQPYSVAGKRKGKEDERHLWPEMLRAIREIQPTWVVGENVSGLVNWSGGLVFDEVQTDLEVEGYEVIPFILPAAGVNAPHKRDRVWFVAKNAIYGGCLQREFKQERAEDGEQRYISTGNNIGFCGKISGITINSDNKRRSTGLGEIQKENGEIPERNDNAEFGDANNRNVANANNERLEGQTGKRIQTVKRRRNQLQTSKFAGIYRERYWQNFPTQSPVCGGNDGISERLDGITFPKWRNESIKAYGNAIVPQVVYQIFKAIEQVEK